MEPDSAQPDDVEHYVNRIGKRVLNECESIRRHMSHRHTNQLGKHHVIPEVEQVKQQAEQDDETQHEHVLRSPLHLFRLYGNGVALTTTCTTVLCREDKSINDVSHSQGCQTQRSHDGIPVGTQQFTNRVISLSREENRNVHTAVERQK